MAVANHQTWGAPAPSWSQAEANLVWKQCDDIGLSLDNLPSPAAARQIIVNSLAVIARADSNPMRATESLMTQLPSAIHIGSITKDTLLSDAQKVEKTEEMRARITANPAYGQLKQIYSEIQGFLKIKTSGQLNRFIDEMSNPSMCERSVDDFFLFRITFSYALAAFHESNTAGDLEAACKHEDDALDGTTATGPDPMQSFCQDMHVKRQIALKFPESDAQSRITYWNVYEVMKFHPDPTTFLTENSDVILRSPVPLLLAHPKWSMANESLMTQMRAALREMETGVEGGSSPQALRRHLPLDAQAMFKPTRHSHARKAPAAPVATTQRPSPFTSVAVADITGGAAPYYVPVENGAIDLGNVLEGFLRQDGILTDHTGQLAAVKQLAAELQDAIRALTTSNRRTRQQVTAQRHLTHQLATVVGASTRARQRKQRHVRGGAAPAEVKPEMQKLVASIGDSAKDKSEIQAAVAALQRTMANFP